MRTLAERPLLLTLMANLHASRGTLPKKRADLYEETVRLSDWLEVEQSKIRALLEELAFDAHASQPAQAEGTANLDGEKLLGSLLTRPNKRLPKAVE